MRIDPEELRKTLDTIVRDPSLKAKNDGTTFCNYGVSRAAKLFGLDLEGKLANQIIDLIRASSAWLCVSGGQASDWAQRGGLGLAVMPGEPHGHVATLYPAPMQVSTSLNREVPVLANVGKNNGIMRASQAFPVAQGEPAYHIYVPTEDK